MKKRALIIGGAGGIGAATSQLFIQHGFEVIVADRDVAAGQKLANSSPIHFIEVDVLSLASIDQLVRSIAERFIHIDHVVNLVGRAHPEEFKSLPDISPGALSESINLNLSSQIHIVQAALPLLTRSPHSNKSITLISSINGIKAYGRPAYSAAKAGLIGLVQALALELGQQNIRVNAVLPGTVLTPLALSEPKDFTRLVEGSLLGRLASSEEVAQLIYAISDLLTCVTAQALVADCGQSAKGYR